MTEFFDLTIPMNPWVVLPLVFFAALIIAYAANLIALWFLRRTFRRSNEELQGRFYRMIEIYFFPLLIIGALLIIINNAPLPPKIPCEVAKEVLGSVNGGVPGFEPFIRYHTFNQSSIDFSVILRGQEFTDNFLIKHEFIKRLHARYRQEGITIPFPIRTVYMQGQDGKTEGNRQEGEGSRQ